MRHNAGVDQGSITAILHEMRDGAPDAEQRLFARVYDELKAMASARMRREGHPHAVEGLSTDLVNDAYVRLKDADFENRRHLFFAYARAMRQILIERARKSRSIKRGGGAERRGDRVDAEELAVSNEAGSARVLDAIAVEEMMERLRGLAPREAEVVELKFFGGLGDADVADLLGIDARTVRRDWATAKERLAAWAAG